MKKGLTIFLALTAFALALFFPMWFFDPANGLALASTTSAILPESPSESPSESPDTTIPPRRPLSPPSDEDLAIESTPSASLIEIGGREYLGIGDALRGMDLRAEPNAASLRLGHIRAGYVVYVAEIIEIDGVEWARVFVPSFKKEGYVPLSALLYPIDIH
ncbi:MAG: SH3 domain-containing protein [Christensenellaceae bacterium]|jgi:hypothetical protein|nr:SH3 domain-containing protein [Christensenellaceae bacterium]